MSKLVASDYEHNIIKALQDIIPDCLFILSGRDGVEPKSPYCLVSIINETRIGQAQRTNQSRIDDNDKYWQTIIQTYEVNYTMTFHGGSKTKSEEWARYLSISLESDFATRVFYDWGLSFLSANSFPRLVVNNNTVSNYLNDTVDITISLTRYEEFPVEVITRVEIEGEYELYQDVPDSIINVGVGRNGEGKGDNEWQ